MDAKGLIPDTTEPIVAARLWGTVPGPTHGMRGLKGFGWGVDWPRDRHLTANCEKGGTSNAFSAMYFGTFFGEPYGPRCDEAPGETCSCGIWGFSDPLSLATPLNEGKQVAVVAGVIEMWGRVICAEKGWRGQHARLVGLVARNPRHLRTAESQVATTYQVPVLTDWPELTPPLPTFMTPIAPKEEPKKEKKVEWTLGSTPEPSSSSPSPLVFPSSSPSLTQPSPSRLSRYLRGLGS